MKSAKWFRLLMTAFALLFIASIARAEWPEKPVTIVIPYDPGGPGDINTRLVAGDLSRRFGQPVVVENRPGAGGNIGTTAVARSAPDGYTILVSATNNFVVNQFLYRDIGFVPLASLEPVTILADIPLVLFLCGQLPTPTFAAFVDYARSNRGKLNYTSPGIGTTLHLMTEIISKMFDLRMVHVPYKGAGPAMQAVLSNEVQVFLVGAGPGAPHVKTGKLHAVAVFSPKRLELLPDTPTAREVGLGDMKANNWWGVAVRKGTPPEIVRKLYEGIRLALAIPSTQERFQKLAATPVGDSPAETGRRWREEADYWRKAIKDADLRID